jgi:hypothetical protein
MPLLNCNALAYGLPCWLVLEGLKQGFVMQVVTFQ